MELFRQSQLHLYFPQTWGWTAHSGESCEIKVFPTGVGMNREIGAQEYEKISIPHRRGDEPKLPSGWKLVELYSPQAWG